MIWNRNRSVCEEFSSQFSAIPVEKIALNVINSLIPF